MQMTLRYKVVMWTWGLPVLRVVLVAAASTTLWLLTGARVTDFPPSPLLSTAAMLPVNILCLLLVTRLVRREGGTVRALIGFRPERIGRDLLWGVLWLFVLYVPFVATMLGVMALRFGSRLFESFEVVFVGGAGPDLPMVVWSALAVLAVLTFAPLNAPVEELVYRGYAQGGLQRRHSAAVAITVPAVLFGLQHLWYAPTVDAALIYVCCFTAWGLVSGLIYRWQKRLMPLILAHGIVNLGFTLPALAILFVNGA